MADQVSEKLEKNGWSVFPNCSWLSMDNDGNPCCKFRALRERLVALGIAEFTVFDQRYVGEAIANWRENFPQASVYSCAPNVCPSRLTRVLNEFHKRQ